MNARRLAGASVRRGLAVALLLQAHGAGAVEAEEAKPLWEVRAVGVGAYTPDYPGSEQMHLHLLPLPWIIYRGRILRTDEEGKVSALFADTRRFGLELSAQGSFPAHSEDNDARRGMPDLDWLGEIGPRVRASIYYWQNLATGRLARLNVEATARAVLSTDFSGIDLRGYVFEPAIAYDDDRFLGAATSLKASLGPVFATGGLMGYFYDVPAGFATATRPQYDSVAGYWGSRLHLRLRRALSNTLSIFAVANFDDFHGAANRDSPLLRSDYNFAVWLGASISLYRSSGRVR